MITGEELAKAYSTGELCGWAEVRHPGLAKQQFNLLSKRGAFIPFVIRNKTRPYAGTKTFLYQVTRKILGADTPNYAQEIGDCVSFGAKNGAEYLQCAEKLMKNDRQKFRFVFPPYYYGTGRVYVGGGQLGNSDGSLGSWMAEAVQKYGTLFADEPNVPKYSGSVAKAWGDPNPSNDLDKWKATGEKFKVRGAAKITTWGQLVEAIANGYPVTTASNVGYDMGPSSDGFHRQRGTWAHQMCFIGVDDGYKNGNEPYALLLNSWGDAHGQLKDFETGEALPVGILRVRRADVEKHLRQDESFAFSDMDGFYERQIDKALFMLV